MSDPVKLIDCSFGFQPEFGNPVQVLKSHAAGFGYVRFISNILQLLVIEQINSSDEATVDGARFCFFKGNAFLNVFPFDILRFIKKQHPDIIMVQGLIFPVQVILLRMFMGRGCRMIVQHHGEQPGRRLKKVLQRLADRCIDAYLFTAIGNADPWISCRIIDGYSRCREILEASTCFERKEKEKSRKRCGISGSLNLLWVGRLNGNKDPFTVLNAFKSYLAGASKARLYMIFREHDLPDNICSFLAGDPLLGSAVRLVGEVPHEELPFWYSAADFYVSGSHSEGSGFALLEAMACGCIPVVTDIPPFRKITGNGQCGFLYTAGDAQALFRVLASLDAVDHGSMSASVLDHFSRELSFKSIAEGIAAICHDLVKGHLQSRCV